jgi:hypothetical protein
MYEDCAKPDSECHERYVNAQKLDAQLKEQMLKFLSEAQLPTPMAGDGSKSVEVRDSPAEESIKTS